MKIWPNFQLQHPSFSKFVLVFMIPDPVEATLATRRYFLVLVPSHFAALLLDCFIIALHRQMWIVPDHCTV